MSKREQISPEGVELAIVYLQAIDPQLELLNFDLLSRKIEETFNVECPVSTIEAYFNYSDDLEREGRMIKYGYSHLREKRT